MADSNLVSSSMTPNASSAGKRVAQSPVRWLLYLGATLFCGGLLVVLQSAVPELSAAVFTIVVLASVLYLIFRSADKIGHFIQSVRLAIMYPGALLRPHAARLSLAAGVGALVLALLSALVFWDSLSFYRLQDEAAKLFLLSMVALWAAFALRPTDLPMTTFALRRPLAEPDVTGFTSNLRLFLRRAGKHLALFSGIALVVIVTEINAQFIKSDLLELGSIHVQFVLLLAGTGLLVIGLSGVRVTAAQPSQTWLERLRPLWPLGLITLLALVLRFWQLDVGMRFLVDERSFIDGIYAVRDMHFSGLLQPFSSISAFPYVFPYFQYLTMGLFGWDLVGVRAASAIVGTLTIPALYFLARTLFDRKTAIMAALLLATLPPHLQFSRIGMNNIADPLVGTLALGFMVSGLKTGKRSHFALAGVMLGFTQYFYEGGRLLFVPLALLTLVGCVAFAQLPDAPFAISPWGAVWLRFRRIRSNVLIMLVGFVVIAAPIYLTLAGMQRPVLARFVDNGLGLGPVYWQEIFSTPYGYKQHITDHILPALEMYFNQIDNTFYYSKTTPLLLTGMLPVVMMGFAFVCYYWRKSGSTLLILWVLATAFGNSLMKNSISSSRFVIAFPALALLAAVGLRYVVPMVVRRARWQTPVIVGLAAILALYQTNFYFNQHLPEYNFVFRASSPGPDGYDAAWRSLKFPYKTQVHLISTPIYNSIEAQGMLLAWRDDIPVDTLLSARLSPRYLEKLACDVDHAFFVQKKDQKVVDILQHYFKLDPPQYTPFTDVDPSERFVLYYAANKSNKDTPYSRYCAHVGKSS